ncbi:Serine carboxypeptidase [Phytophthora infestans]|uniref:Serine carboxypeptidase n=1 Tax=Phytophthora infestans TaxID=4787 RepID=A0A833WFC6_PHYIN|nr:Serine carboxypeptidase [Phytophthora infestans]KAI9998965.1 hypothetical protein PInf_003629 [Phytophthora infestans]
MATETTPLLQSHRRPQEQYAHHKRRIAGLVLLGFVLMVAAVLTTTNIGTKTYPQAAPQHPIAVAEPHTDLKPLNSTRHHHTPAPTSKNWFHCGTEESEADYITLPYNVDDHLFYWFFESRKAPDTDPLILSDATTALNPYSWTSEANVVWLDQSTSFGFSYGSKTRVELNAEDVQMNVYWFLQGFLDKHPELEGRALFLAGEGYASHYVPAAAHYIWRENLIVKKANATVRINLQGIAIGNSLVNPVVQLPHTLDMAVSNSYNISLIKPTDLAAMK